MAELHLFVCAPGTIRLLVSVGQTAVQSCIPRKREGGRAGRHFVRRRGREAPATASAAAPCRSLPRKLPGCSPPRLPEPSGSAGRGRRRAGRTPPPAEPSLRRGPGRRRQAATAGGAAAAPSRARSRSHVGAGAGGALGSRRHLLRAGRLRGAGGLR